MTPSRHPPLPPEASGRIEAIGLMIIAVGLFSALDTAAKWLVTRDGLPVVQVVWARFIVQFLAILVLVPALRVMTVRALFSTNRPELQLVRSMLMVATTAFNFLALEFLRLDQTITIVFLAPLVVALLSGPFLGEWVGWRRFLAILIGFAGILIAMRPGAGTFQIAVVYSLIAMLAYALFMLLTRYMATMDPPLVTLFYSMFAGTFAGAPLAYSAWVAPPDATAWALLGSLGVFGGLGHWLFIHAYRRAPATAIAPFLYMQLLTMVGFGYVVFGDIPDQWTLMGSAVVIASGIYLVHRERVVHQVRQRAAEPPAQS